jgi:serine/threonine protein kinase
LENYNKKYPTNKKSKGLHSSLISLYSRQILSLLAYLHERKIFHLHLHSGNILIDEKINKIKITGIENFICDFTIRNENYFNFLLENFNKNTLNKPNNSDLFVDIFRSEFNVFEKFDIISFGRILYEMVFGKELYCPYPDEIEFKSIDEEIAKVFRLIFNRKESRNGTSHKCSVPEVSAKDLLKIKFFNLNNKQNLRNEVENKKNDIEEGIFYNKIFYLN